MVTPINGTNVDPPTRTDAELVTDILAGRPGALDQLFRRYVRVALAVAQRILNDRAEAEDVTQEVFLEIYRKAHLYDPARGSFRVWLMQYVYHRTLRRKAALKRRAAYRAEPLETLDDRTPAGRSPLTPDECGWVLRRGLAQLSHRQRTTIELTCFEDLPLRDVAQRLGVSVGCTRHYYYRGLARLRKWAGVTDSPAGQGRAALPADRADAATTRERPQYARI